MLNENFKFLEKQIAKLKPNLKHFPIQCTEHDKPLSLTVFHLLQYFNIQIVVCPYQQWKSLFILRVFLEYSPVHSPSHASVVCLHCLLADRLRQVVYPGLQPASYITKEKGKNSSKSVPFKALLEKETEVE